MDGYSASEKAEKTKSKHEAPSSVSLRLSVALALKIDCELSRTYECCDHIMDHSMGREWQMSWASSVYLRGESVSDGLAAFGGYKDDLSSLMCLFVFL